LVKGDALASVKLHDLLRTNLTAAIGNPAIS
jgi:hypothetical protein